MEILTEPTSWNRPRIPRTFELSDTEKANVTRALHLMRVRLGSWQLLADRMGCHRQTVKRVARGGIGKGKHPTAGLALYAARAVGASLEEVLSGAWAGLHPGHQGAHRRLEGTHGRLEDTHRRLDLGQ